MPAVSMTVNGKLVTGDVEARTLLVQFLRENLRLTGTYRRDRNELPNNRATTTYSVYEIRLDYRIGKIIVNASYGHYSNLSAFGLMHSAGNGSTADRLRFRIVRTFTLF